MEEVGSRRIKTDISQASMQAAASFLPSSLARPQITYIFIILGTLNGRRREDPPLPPRARPLLSPAVAEKERNGGGGGVGGGLGHQFSRNQRS